MKNIATLPNITIKQAMKNLNKIGEKCLVIVDESIIVLGTLSDGDIRKGILNGNGIHDSIEQI